MRITLDFIEQHTYSFQPVISTEMKWAKAVVREWNYLTIWMTWLAEHVSQWLSVCSDKLSQEIFKIPALIFHNLLLSSPSDKLPFHYKTFPFSQALTWLHRKSSSKRKKMQYRILEIIISLTFPLAGLFAPVDAMFRYGAWICRHSWRFSSLGASSCSEEVLTLVVIRWAPHAITLEKRQCLSFPNAFAAR